MKLFISSLFILASVSHASAQDCKNFWYLTNDAQVEVTVYDANGNENGKQEWKVDDVKRDGTGWMATVKTKFTDKKGRDGSKAKGVYRCDGAVLKADVLMSLPQDQMQAYKNMNVKADEGYIDYPINLSSGQSLSDANYKMETYNNGNLAATITFKESNRKVGNKESVTTSAGTWNAFKITYDSQFKTEIGNTGRAIPMNFKVTEWFAPGFGVIKSETYGRNGKLIGSTQLTSLKK
jgi:hypothetical protein